MNKLIVILIITIFANSCVDINAYQEDMRKLRKNFPDSSFVHFPSTVNSTYNLISRFPYGYSKSNRCGVLLIFNQSIEKTEALKKATEEKYEGFDLNDSCVAIVNGNFGKTGKQKFCKTYIKPLPDIQKAIERCKFCNNIDSINEADFKYYLVGAEQGVFIENKSFEKSINHTNAWKHGISKGIAINENNGTVIFWLEIW